MRFEVLRKVVDFTRRQARKQLDQFLDERYGTFCPHSPKGPLCLRLIGLRLPDLPRHRPWIQAISQHVLAHRFNLLGSGWVEIKHGMVCGGLEGHHYQMGAPVVADSQGRWLEGRINPSNLLEAQRLWHMVREGYTPIDWQLDFKSGYRWSERQWSGNIRYALRQGADIKVPWELARMQHLASLALAFALSKEGAAGFKAPSVYLREFQNQVLDFSSTNPPGFGVNWVCAMDVAIRAANWLVAYDLFRAYGAQFDSEFEGVFLNRLYEHGLHIVGHLEWRQELRNNHYLADIVGLLFLAAYLPRSPEIDCWLAFGVQELIVETACQFHEDGTNFEASTAYHRLSAEMVIAATALVLGLPQEKRLALREYDQRHHRFKPPLNPPPLPFWPVPMDSPEPKDSPFPAWYFKRLEKMAEFVMHTSKPDGRIPQIGDNDSGRFLKLQQRLNRISVAEAKRRYANLKGYAGLSEDADYWDEDQLDNRYLVAAATGLFKRLDFSNFADDYWEKDLIAHLAGGTQLRSYHPSDLPSAIEEVLVGTKDILSQWLKRAATVSGDRRADFEISVPGLNPRSGLELHAYPDFGLFLFRSARLYLIVRCGPIGQNGIGGHAHNDQLSIELNIDGKDWILDPGSYLYTPLPHRRNEYRSIKAHFAPQLEGREPGPLDPNLFRLKAQPRAQCLFFGREGLVGAHWAYGCALYRVIRLEQGITITDFVTDDARLARLHPSPRIGRGEWSNPVAFSPGYGIRLAEKIRS